MKSLPEIHELMDDSVARILGRLDSIGKTSENLHNQIAIPRTETSFTSEALLDLVDILRRIFAKNMISIDICN